MSEVYLPHPADKLSYAISMRWMARCDLFAPISQSAADDLAALLNVPRDSIAVTGCPLDPAFEAIPSLTRGIRPRHFPQR